MFCKTLGLELSQNDTTKKGSLNSKLFTHRLKICMISIAWKTTKNEMTAKFLQLSIPLAVKIRLFYCREFIEESSRTWSRAALTSQTKSSPKFQNKSSTLTDLNVVSQFLILCNTVLRKTLEHERNQEKER